MNQKGSILIFSLWILAFLGVIATTLSFRAKLSLKLTQSREQHLQLEQMGRMAVATARSAWKAHKRPALSKEYPLSRGSFSFSRLEEESGKINLNAAPPEVLTRAFGRHALLVPAVLNWRGTGNAGNSDYQGRSYVCRLAPFKSLEELLLVKGMTPEIFKEVRGLLTVYGDGGVNVNAASSEVLLALGWPESLVRKTIFFRQGRDGIEGTPDDGVFSDAGALLDTLKARSSISEDEQKALATSQETTQLMAETEAVSFAVVSRLNDTPHSARFSIVMAVRPDLGRMMSWREMR